MIGLICRTDKIVPIVRFKSANVPKWKSRGIAWSQWREHCALTNHINDTNDDDNCMNQKGKAKTQEIFNGFSPLTWKWTAGEYLLEDIKTLVSNKLNFIFVCVYMSLSVRKVFAIFSLDAEIEYLHFAQTITVSHLILP